MKECATETQRHRDKILEFFSVPLCLRGTFSLSLLKGGTMGRQILCASVVVLIICGAWQSAIATEPVVFKASHLRCENLIDPLGLDEKEPRLSWIVESDQRGQKQTAYRILIATSQQALSDGQS